MNWEKKTCEHKTNNNFTYNRHFLLSLFGVPIIASFFLRFVFKIIIMVRNYNLDLDYCCFLCFATGSIFTSPFFVCFVCVQGRKRRIWSWHKQKWAVFEWKKIFTCLCVCALILDVFPLLKILIVRTFFSIHNLCRGIINHSYLLNGTIVRVYIHTYTSYIYILYIYNKHTIKFQVNNTKINNKTETRSYYFFLIIIFNYIQLI